MGEVWLATHDASGQAVAVKWIRPEKAPRASTRAAFAREVEAMAAMDHPGVILVFDHGQAATGESFVVMELASLGSLDGRPPASSWSELVAMLRATLDALAHAHARGVVHRDLKPGNLLMCGPDDPRPGLKLADFGLATILETSGPGARTAGTPSYMAPEQFQGRWRDLGPETDLYALGCVAWQLACGTVPYPQTTLTELRQHHLHAPPPPLTPRFSVAAGFDGWLRWLLEKDASARPESAAAAAYELAQLPPPIDDAPFHSQTPIPARRSTPTFTWDAIEIQPTGPLPTTTAGSQEDLPTPPPSVAPSVMPRARHALPFPERWQDHAGVRPPLLLAGAGLGLFAVRRAPFTARRKERGRLWSALRRAIDHGPAGVVVHGAPGVGTTRLATWVAERAAELGLARSIVIRFGAADAADRWIEQHFHLQDLDTSARVTRFAGLLMDPSPMQAWARGTLPASTAIAAWLLSEARLRPYVLVLDDASASPDAVSLARQLVETREVTGAPILVVATTRDDADPAVLDRLETVLDTEWIPLEPLGLTDTVDLLAGTLDIDPALAARLHATTAGNPGLVLHVVGDWVERGALRAAPHGFVVDDAFTAHLPADLEAAWRQRAAALVDRLDAPARDALALAIVRSGDPSSLWGDVATRAGLDPNGLTDRLVGAGLAQRGPDGGLRFASPAVVVALRELLPRDVQLASHQTWVDALADDPDKGARAEHLFEVGRFEEAAQAWLDATIWTSDRASEALFALDRAEAALDRAGVDPYDARRFEIRYRRTTALINLGRPTAEPELERLIEAARHPRAPGNFVQRVTNAHAQYLAKHGRIAEATELAQRLVAQWPDFDRGWVLLATLAILRMDVEGARKAAEYALSLPLQPYQRASALTTLAEACRFAGDLDRAAALHRESLAMSLEHGWRDALTSALNLAQVDMQRGEWRTGLLKMEELVEQSRSHLEWFHVLATLCMAAHAAARLNLWDRFDRHFEQIPAVDRIVVTPDPDIAYHLRDAARLARDAGFPDRARRAASRARRHAELLGLHDVLAELDGFLA